MNKESDKYYLNGISNNDRKIIREMYQVFLPRITKFVLANNGNENDALDIFQEAMIVLFHKVNQDFTLTSALYTFLYAVSRNIWFNRLKKRKVIRVTSEELEVSSEENLIDSINQKDRYQLYREKFKQLGESCQSILKLFFEGNSMRQIAEKLSISEKYARKRKFNCKEKLIELVQADPKFKELNYE